LKRDEYDRGLRRLRWGERVSKSPTVFFLKGTLLMFAGHDAEAASESFMTSPRSSPSRIFCIWARSSAGPLNASFDATLLLTFALLSPGRRWTVRGPFLHHHAAGRGNSVFAWRSAQTMATYSGVCLAKE
jgi:hypothetical protein